MRRQAISLAVLALLPLAAARASATLHNGPTAFSAAASIDAPATAPEHTLIQVSTPTAGTGFAWFLMRDAEFVEWIAINADRSQIVFTGPPGRYVIMLVVLVGDGRLEQAHAQVVIEGDNPPPPPPPPPPPIVNPYKPDPALKPAVGPVTKLKLFRSDASQLAKVFHQLSIDVQPATHRGGPFASYQGLADEMARRGAALKIKGKYAGLATAVTKAFKTVLGEAERPIDVKRTAAFLETLAWAVWETGK